MSTALKILSGLVLALSLGTALACTEGTKGCDVAKKEWIDFVRSELPQSFCSAGSLFVKCSDATPAQCRKIATPAVNDCLAELDKAIPPLLNRSEAVERGERLGDCTGGKLFKAIKLRANKDPDCAGLM